MSRKEAKQDAKNSKDPRGPREGYCVGVWVYLEGKQGDQQLVRVWSFREEHHQWVGYNPNDISSQMANK